MVKFVQSVFSGLQSKEELLELIETAEINKYIGPESRVMLEGVLSISEMRAGDIMVPAPRMDMLDIALGMDELLEKVIQIGHSRYPVYENDRENIIGVLMAKDLLNLARETKCRWMHRQVFLGIESWAEALLRIRALLIQGHNSPLARLAVPLCPSLAPSRCWLSA